MAVCMLYDNAQYVYSVYVLCVRERKEERGAQREREREREREVERER